MAIPSSVRITCKKESGEDSPMYTDFIISYSGYIRAETYKVVHLDLVTT